MSSQILPDNSRVEDPASPSLAVNPWRRCETHIRFEPDSMLGHQTHRHLYRYWLSKAPPDRLPSRNDIDPVDIPQLLPWIVLVDVVRGGAALRLRHRLIGTGIVERVGRDVTGGYFDELYDEQHHARVLEDYACVIKSRAPLMSRIAAPVPGLDFLQYDRLALPLADDGETVTTVMSLVVFQSG